MAWKLVGRAREFQRARDLVESGTGVALVGAAGVGKTRLLREVIGHVDEVTLPTLQLTATVATRSIPFAPFAALVPTAPAWDRLEVFREALGALRGRVGPRGLLLALDDAQYLDAGSLALLGAVTRQDGITVCLTARTAEPMDADLVGLWTDGALQRIDIGPLQRDEVLALLDTTLGPVEPALGEELWRLSAGNPLVLHELVQGAAGTTMARGVDGTWRQMAELSSSPRLADLVSARLQRVPDDLRSALALVAVGDPVPLTLLEDAVGPRLHELERLDLVRVTGRHDEACEVVPAHPLYGEILTRQLSATRLREANRTLLAAALRTGAADPLRVALWQQGSGKVEDPEVAVEGARAALARHDAQLAERLARPVIDGSPRAATVLGRALTLQRCFQEAEELLCSVTPDTTDTHVELASARAHNLAFGLGRVADATGVLAAAADVVDAAARARLDTERGIISAMRGDFVEAEQAGRSVVANSEASPAARAAGYVSLTLALAMMANCRDLDEILPDAFAAATAAQSEVPFAAEQVAVMELRGLSSDGTHSEAF